MSRTPVDKLISPESIAIVGAGNNPMKMGTLHALSIKHDGFRGPIYPVHPKEKTVAGMKAYPSVDDLPEAPDMVMFVIPSRLVAEYMEAFGRIGTKAAIVVTAGYKETGEAGGARESELSDIAGRYGMRFLGPNCMGVINTGISLNTTVHALDPGVGNLGIVSQSGTYVTQAIDYLDNNGIHFSKAVSVGNEANINLVDILEFLGDDEQTKAIGMYIETIRDIPRFLETARRITRRKPVVAQYVGGTEAGARAGLSHTGALAGPDHLYDGLFRQAGILRMFSIQDIFQYGGMLASQPRLKGPRIGIVTNSGGPGSAIADTCEKGGLEVPTLSHELQAKIKTHLAEHAPAFNPVDLTFTTDVNILTKKIPGLLMESGEVDGVIIHGAHFSGFLRRKYDHIKELLPPGQDREEFLAGMEADLIEGLDVNSRYGAPMAISSFYDRKDGFTRTYHEKGIPVFNTPERAARGMSYLWKASAAAGRPGREQPVIPTPSDTALDIISDHRSRGLDSIDEYHSKKLLASYGIPVSDDRLVRSRAELEAALDDAPFPAVLKVCDPGIMHKTERGLVFLNLAGRDDAIAAYEKITDEMGGEAPAVLSGMVSGGREFIAGVARTPGFGPAVAFGAGGILAEAVRDTSFRLAPVTGDEARELASDIRCSALLGEFRGLPAVDMDALTGLLQTLGAIPVMHPSISEIDLNPVIIAGDSPVVADALITLA